LTRASAPISTRRTARRTTDYAHAKDNTLAWTPELGEGIPGNGFVFPDDEGLIQQEFLKTLPFALDVAKSAPNPAQPVSHLWGNTVKPFYLELSSIEPELSDPQGDFASPSPTVTRSQSRCSRPARWARVALKYQVNGGAVQSAPTAEWNGGERFGGPGDVLLPHHAWAGDRHTTQVTM